MMNDNAQFYLEDYYEDYFKNYWTSEPDELRGYSSEFYDGTWGEVAREIDRECSHVQILTWFTLIVGGGLLALRLWLMLGGA